MAIAIAILPTLQTNYTYLIVNAATKMCVAVDPADAETVAAVIRGQRLTLTHILSTHHHADHTGGNLTLKGLFGAKVAGAGNDVRIPGRDIAVEDGDQLEMLGETFFVLTTPGHTRGSVCYRLGEALFTGDTLFAMGCGKLFEGDAATMTASLARIAALPDRTTIYPGHEYTLTDARFAQTIEPDNAAIRDRLVAVKAGDGVVPFSLAAERRTNPFLRTDSPGLRQTLQMTTATDVDVFAEIRRRKDAF